MHEIKRVQPFRHCFDCFLKHLLCPLAPAVPDIPQKPCHPFLPDFKKLPEIVHPSCHAKLLDSLIAEAQQFIPVPAAVIHALVQAIDDLGINFHIAVCVKNIAVDIPQDVLTPPRKPVRMTVPLILQYHVQLLYGKAQSIHGHPVNVRNGQLHCLLAQFCNHRPILTALLHHLCLHDQLELSSKLSLVLTVIIRIIIIRQQTLRHPKIRFLDGAHNLLSPLPDNIVLTKQKVFIPVTANAKSGKNPVPKLLA